jgi:hypothetical protein
MPSGGVFRDILRRSFGEEQATEQLEIAARWGRSAERFEFDAKTPQFCIEREAEPDTVRAGGGVRKC